MTLSTGTKIGSYEITGAIGAGGMGEVYRARDTKLGRDVAIKVLPEAFARDAERMARFEREAKVLASLNHPNIAAIYGFEDSGSVRALVMELVEGPTLAERIRGAATAGTSPTPAGLKPRSVPSVQADVTQASRGEPDAGLKPGATQAEPARAIPIEEALRIARQMADALEYAHERSVVHRDLKPANIKISREDLVKILDFGLAKAIEGDAWSMDMGNSPTLTHMATQAGVLLGTASYMSPEQAKAKLVDRRADIWAFGCVLYEMLTGKMAFHGETVTDTLAAVVMKDPDWSLLPANTPARIRALLQRCLQKDVKQRLQAIGEARITLDEVLAGAPEPSSSAGASAAPAPVPFWLRALPWAAAVAIAIAFAAFALIHFGEKAAAPTQVMRFEIPMPPKVTLTGADIFELSPDGSQLAFYAAGADGIPHIWIRPLDSLEAHPLPGTETSDAPFFWSPDSRRIAWGTGGKLEIVDVSTGAIQTQTLSGTAFSVGGSWNRDGAIILGQAGETAGGAGGLMRVSANGGTVSPVTQSGGIFPSFLPDGRHFIYFGGRVEPGSFGIYIGSLDAQPRENDLKRLVETRFAAEYAPSSSNPNVGQLLFLTSDGTLMAQPFDARESKLAGAPVPVAQHVGFFRQFAFFSASGSRTLVYREGGGAYQLTWFDGHGKIIGTSGEPGSYGPPALSPDGTKAVFEGVNSQGFLALWMMDFSRNTTTRFTFGSSAADYPIWSPDGKRVIYSSSPNGTVDLYQKPANGEGGEQLLLKSNENKTPSDVSHDGRFLLYKSQSPKTKNDLWVLPLQGDRKPFPFLRTQFNEVDAHFSPDGHWVVYESDESGRDEIYVRPFSPDPGADDASGAGAKWQISYDGGGEPQWRADGKELYYLTQDSKLMEVDVTTSPTFQAGTPKLLFAVPEQTGEGVGDYTIDGKRFLFLAPAGQAGQAPFTVVLNWQAGLKAQQ